MKGATMSDNQDPTTEVSDLYSQLGKIGKARHDDRRDEIGKELTQFFADIISKYQDKELPIGFAMKLRDALGNIVENLAMGTTLPELGSSNTGSDPVDSKPTVGGKPLTSDEEKLVLAGRVGNFDFDPDSGQIKGFQQIAQATDGLQRLEVLVGSSVGDRDNVSTRFKRVEDEVRTLKQSASAGGKGVDTSKLAMAAGLAPDAPIERLTDKIKELAKRPDAKIDTSSIAQALGKPDNTSVDDLAKAATEAKGWEHRAAEIGTKVKEITGLDYNKGEGHVDYVTRGLQHGPVDNGKKRGWLPGGRS